MNLPAPNRSTRFFATVALALLVLGIALDAGLTQPRRREIRRLSGRRDQLLIGVSEAAAREREGRELARFFRAEDPGAALYANEQSDPVSFLGRTLDLSHLTREEMVVQSASSKGRLTATGISLRVQGDYASILDFVRRLEQGPRIVTVDALSLIPAPGSSQLQGRLDVSVYEVGETHTP